jgi:hypothetical protein
MASSSNKEIEVRELLGPNHPKHRQLVDLVLEIAGVDPEANVAGLTLAISSNRLVDITVSLVGTAPEPQTPETIIKKAAKALDKLEEEITNGDN